MTHPRLLSALAGISLAVFAIPHSAGAAGPQPLFTAGNDSAAPPLNHQGQGAHRHGKRPDTALPGKSRGVGIDRAQLHRNRLLLNLGVGPDLDVVRERLVQHGTSHEAWIGHVAGDPDSEVILTRAGEAVAGSIRHHGRLYRLTPGAGGSQHLAEVSAQTPLPSTEIVPDLPAGDAGDGTIATASITGTTVIDLLFGYTPEAKARYGGSSGVEAVIALAVEETNQAFLNSGAPVELRLVATAETGYHDTGDMNTDLIRLTLPTDGHADDLATLREAVGADLVSLLVDTGSYCGLSWQLGALDPAYAAYGFSVVNTLCATGYYSTGHEIGHNLGLSHDHDNASSGLFAYSYGYQDPAAQFRTIMAYNCDAGCTRVQHFSNPEIDYAGAPTGVAGWADSALALADTAPMVTTWRASPTPVPPNAPSELTATTSGYDAIDLSWTDEATDEDGYQVERSDDAGQTFAPIATLPADTGAYADSGLLPETAYIYRVSAYNGGGFSTPSEEAWATTDPAPVPVPAAPTDLSAITVSDAEIALAWTDNAADETGFELERSGDDGVTWTLLASLAADVTGMTDQGLVPATAYSYRVRATGAGDPSAYSGIASAVTDPEPVYPPAAPTALTASAVSESGIALAWIDNAADEAAYEIERSANGGLDWTPVAGLDADAIAWTDSGLDAGTWYLYRVRATGAGGASDWSNEAGATTVTPAPECAAVGANDVSLGDRDMSWQITNTGGNVITISRVQLTWPSAQGDLRRMVLGGSQFWNGSDAPTTADIAGGWSDPGALVLGAGHSATLRFDFKRRDRRDHASDYAITVDFAEGCTIRF